MGGFADIEKKKVKLSRRYTRNMLTEQIVRDVGEIHGRLFDHRPILQGHIRAFVKEFEEKRGDREIERLEKLKNTVTAMKDQYIDETQGALDTFLFNTHAKLKVALEVCRKIEEKENNVEVAFLQLERVKRRENWDLFMQEQFDKSAQVDQHLDEEMKRLSTEYAELEAKLDAFVPSTPK